MWLLLSLAGFALAVLLHAVFTRMGGSLTIVLSFLIVSIPVTVLIAAVALWMFAISDESIAAILVYAACCETYIFLFTLAANGVSISLMMRLRSRPTAADELMKSYSTRAMVERRIDHLRTGGFLMEAGGQIRLLKRGKALVRVFAVARSFLSTVARSMLALSTMASPASVRGLDVLSRTAALVRKRNLEPHQALVRGRRCRVPSLTSSRMGPATTVAGWFAPTRAGNRRETP